MGCVCRVRQNIETHSYKSENIVIRAHMYFANRTTRLRLVLGPNLWKP
jgi:hypothetical protein